MSTALPCGHLPCWLVLQEVGKESIRDNSCCSSPQSDLGRLVLDRRCARSPELGVTVISHLLRCWLGAHPRRTAGTASTRGEVPVVGHVSPGQLVGPAGSLWQWVLV